MEKESAKHVTVLERSIRGLLAFSLYLASFAPAPPLSPIREPKPGLVGTIYFSHPPEIEITPLPGPEPDPEPETEDDSNILEVPGVGKFWRTNIVLEGEASTYSRAGCLGCREDRLMANGEPLDDDKLTLATPPNGPIPLNSFVLVENITESNGNPDGIPRVVAKVTDTGGFEELGRIADLSLTTNHSILGGVWGGSRPLQVRLTRLEPAEP